ncbi:MAG: sugar phosphate nucleotidyltransferase [Planctomycetota bacterium]
MKGIILAGGLGSRLHPLTLVTNKHLLPVYERPMIHYPIRCLLNAGIDDVLVVTGAAHTADFRRLLGDGADLGLRRLAYASQEGEGGIADALAHAEEFAADERVCVVLGDNIIEKSIRPAADAFREQPSGARLLLKSVPDPHRFGVAAFARDGRIEAIVEKPENPPSDLAVTGIYFYDPDVFDICRSLKPSARGELEITDVNSRYLERGDLAWSRLEGWWVDAGTHESLSEATRLVAEGGANHAE